MNTSRPRSYTVLVTVEAGELHTVADWRNNVQWYWSETTGIIPQRNTVFVYCKERNTFDVFNRSTFIFISEMEFDKSEEEILNNLINRYPSTNPDVIREDYCNLQKYFEIRGYINRVKGFFTIGPETRDEFTKIVHADIELTRNCNLHCTYCYANSLINDSELPFNEWRVLLDNLYNQGLRAIVVSGGEPFIYHDFERFIE